MIYRLKNAGSKTCRLFGYPTVSLYDGTRQLPFRFTRDHSQYMTHARPRAVLLPPGRSAYFIVAKFRCDIGTLAAVTTIRVYLPNHTEGFTASSSPPTGNPGVQTFTYCKDQPSSNQISVSALEQSAAATAP